MIRSGSRDVVEASDSDTGAFGIARGALAEFGGCFASAGVSFPDLTVIHISHDGTERCGRY